MSARPRRRRQATRPLARSRALPRWLMLDLLVVCCLALPWLALVGYVAATPPSREAFGIAAAPDAVIFRNFYGIEQNGGGQFRWGKPEASISIPVSAPATYAITLTMQDSPAVPAPRVAAIYADGQVVGSAALGAAPQQYRVIAPLGVGQWGGVDGRMLHIETAVAPFVPPGDPRQLGPIVSQIEIEPIGGGVAWPLVLGAALVLLAGLYATMRLLELPPALAAGFVGVGIAGYALAAFADRSAALALTYRPVTQPLAFAAILAGLVGLPLLGGAGTRRFAGAAPPTAAPSRESVTSRARLATGATLAGIVVLGLGLRLYRLNHLSLWLDETSTIYFARFSWPRVLGLEGWYDNHPPLYFSLIKLASLVLPEVSAARIVSAVAGAATLPVVAALVARLSNWRAGLLAALLLAVSPLHIWYSQEARMYTPVVLCVAVSYLALVGFAQTAARRWALVYGASVALALYIDYSAIYALTPQIVALGIISWRWRRRALVLWGTALGAVCCFLPWVPNILYSIDSEGRNRESFLGATPDKVASVALSAIGLKNDGNYLWGPIGAFWQGKTAVEAILLVGMVATALIGAAVLARRSPIGLATALGLALGTFATAIITSLISPGFAERTVLAATLGWAILLAVAACGIWGADDRTRWLPRPYNAVAIVGVALTLVVSVASLLATYQGAYKEDNRALAAAAEQGARAGVPVIMEGWLEAAATAYHSGLAISAESIAGEAEQFWWAYGDYTWVNIAAQRAEYERLGYVRLLHHRYDTVLFLDYYARPGTLPAGAVPVDLAATLGSQQIPPDLPTEGNSWRLPTGATLDASGAVRFAGPGEALLSLPAQRDGLYLLATDTTDGQVTIDCRGASGEGPPRVRAGVATGEGPLWLAMLCPPDTAALAITLRSDQPGGGEFRALRLWRVPTPEGR